MQIMLAIVLGIISLGIVYLLFIALPRVETECKVKFIKEINGVLDRMEKMESIPSKQKAEIKEKILDLMEVKK